MNGGAEAMRDITMEDEILVGEGSCLCGERKGCNKYYMYDNCSNLSGDESHYMPGCGMAAATGPYRGRAASIWPSEPELRQDQGGVEQSAEGFY